PKHISVGRWGNTTIRSDQDHSSFHYRMLERKINRHSTTARYTDHVSFIYFQRLEQLVQVFEVRKGLIEAGRLPGPAQIVPDNFVFRGELGELVIPRSAVDGSSVDQDNHSSAAGHLVV